MMFNWLRSKSKLKQLKRQLEYSVPKFTLCLLQDNNASFNGTKVIRPEDAAHLLKPLRLATEERFMVMHLNVKHEVIGIHEAAHGTLTESLVHPREVFKTALLANSYAILVCHNHPSGSTIVASPEDYTVTKQLIAAGKVLGVNLVDHLILNCDRESELFYSFRQEHPNLWLEEKTA